MRIKPAQILPSQDFLKESTVRHILECYERGDFGSLPPPPIVRHDPDHEGNYIAIDGHNLLAVQESRGEPCGVYLVDSADDTLPNPRSDPAIVQRNKDLVLKFHTSVQGAHRLNASFRILAEQFIKETSM